MALLSLLDQSAKRNMHHHHHRTTTAHTYTHHHPQPPPLTQRADITEARRLGSSQRQRAALSALTAKSVGNTAAQDGADAQAQQVAAAAAAQVRRNADDDSDDDADYDPKDTVSLAGSIRPIKSLRRPHKSPLPLTPAQKAERSYHRMAVAFAAADGAALGTRAELVLGFCGRETRFIAPWVPLLPNPSRRPDPALLRVLRADATGLALALYRLQAATGLVDAETRPVLRAVTAEGGVSWDSLRADLLAALRELVDAFPQDYYPPPRALDAARVDSFQRGAAALAGEWRRRAAPKGGDGDGKDGGIPPAARLHAALALQQLEDVGVELRRVHDAAAAAAAALERATYGFLGLPCCLKHRE